MAVRLHRRPPGGPRRLPVFGNEHFWGVYQSFDNLLMSSKGPLGEATGLCLIMVTHSAVNAASSKAHSRFVLVDEA